MPLISIIVPCYNQAQYLDECLQSVLEQTYQNWECIIVNDGSTDNTEKIAKIWTQKDSRFRYIYKQNGGLSSARNFGLKNSSGEWIQFLDSDDIILSEKLEKSLKYANHGNIIITNFSILIDGKTEEPFCDLTKQEINLQNIIKGWDVYLNIPVHCVLIQRNLIGNTIFNESLKAKEDWIFWIEIFYKKMAKAFFIKENLVSYRQHQEGLSKNFEIVYQATKKVNAYIYENFDDEVKALIFEKINENNFILNNTVYNQKKFIKQLQNTKILKLYLRLKSFFTRYKH